MSSNIVEHIEEEPIEDCSDQEGEAPLATETPAHVFGPFAALVGGRHLSGEVSTLNDAGQDDVRSGMTQDLAAVVDDGSETGAVTSEGLAEEIVNPTIETEHDEERRHDDITGASFNEDGTVTGGPTSVDEFEDNRESMSKMDFEASADARVEERFAESDSDPDVLVADDIPDEAWMSRPVAERELWERMRPRHVRREAARVKALKLPAAAINRIEKLHPDLQTKTSESLEVINYATVLLVQAVARAAAGRKGGASSVRFEDLRQVCASTRELQFLLPLSGTLDNTALVSGSDRQDEARRGAFDSAQMEPDPGQSTLNRAAFARLASAAPKRSSQELHTPDDDALASEAAVDENSAANFTPEKVNGKRKLQLKDNPKSSKSVRRGAHDKKILKGKSQDSGTPPLPGLSNFFRRIEAVAN